VNAALVEGRNTEPYDARATAAIGAAFDALKARLDAYEFGDCPPAVRRPWRLEVKR